MIARIGGDTAEKGPFKVWGPKGGAYIFDLGCTAEVLDAAGVPVWVVEVDGNRSLAVLSSSSQLEKRRSRVHSGGKIQAARVLRYRGASSGDPADC